MPTLNRKNAWCWTFNNYPSGAHTLIIDQARSLGEDIKYLCFQPERGEENDTPHLQGYVYFRTPRTLVGVRRCLFTGELGGVSLRFADGTGQQNRDYCSKLQTFDESAGFGFTEYGSLGSLPSRSGQGSRNDLYDASQVIQNGASLTTVATDFPDLFVKYHKGFKALQTRLFCRPRVRDDNGDFPPIEVFWFYGSTGTGKTRTVYELIGDRPYFTKSPGTKWFDGYNGEEIVMFDDFRASWFPFNFLLRCLDRYPLSLEGKGCHIEWCPRIIYITSPCHPKYCYPSLAQDDGQIAQLLRRITEIRLFGEEPPTPNNLFASTFNPPSAGAGECGF